MKISSIFAIMIAMVILVSCVEKKPEEPTQEDINKMEQQLRTFIDNFVKEFQPLEEKANLAYWTASNKSTPENWEAYSKCDMAMNAKLADPTAFAELKKIKESNLVNDSVLIQAMTNLYNGLLSKQADTTLLNKISALTSQIEQKYSDFRTVVGKKTYSDNDVEEILQKSADSKELEQVWTEQKKIGPTVAYDIIALVKLRNKLAKKLGFNNFHEMSLTLSGENPKEISDLFDELDALTKDAFASLKSDIDAKLSEKLNIKPEELMPWHFQNRFFQEAPQIYDVDLDKYYAKQDLVKLTTDYYNSINLEISDMVAKSDLFERANKNQHAYCIDINRDKKDIRVLCNVKPNSKWMETMLHEYGHALYEKYLGDDLIWVIKQPAHIFTTEAVAMFFGRQSSNPQWMVDMKLIDEKERDAIAPTTFKILRLQQLVFSRWAQVMYRFEKALYDNPDQNLNKLWWDLVEKYQMLKRPEDRNMPDWATKIHIATSPCYYHNYLLGELFASQMYIYLAQKEGNANNNYISFYGNASAGDFFRNSIFAPGAKYYWNDMIERATGEKLTAKYFAKQFVNVK
ncbi:MAG: hypothetical protein A2X64_00300 [Ignavibacteria bacterium GWF2_33_9]|nr:MAG: hypothetical protein A2X64_00300 [Ignavibacteria bacterium GWF2_33_9]